MNQTKESNNTLNTSRATDSSNKGIWANNAIGMNSFILMLIGVAATLIPLMGIVAFFTLPISFILSLISLFKRKTPKWPAVLGLVGSTVAMLANVISVIFWLFLIGAAIWGFVVGLPDLLSTL